MFVRPGSVVSRICFPTAPKRLLQQYRHEADVTWAQRDVRFQGESGHDADWLSLPSLTQTGHGARRRIQIDPGQWSRQVDAFELKLHKLTEPVVSTEANCKSNGNTHMQDLTGRTAFITGAASGIGLGIATALSQAGVKVMLCDIEEEALTTAVEKLKLTNADVDGVRADVSLKAEIKAAADATVSRYGRVHILVNNAGVAGGRGYGHWTDAGWDWVLGVNLMAVIWGIEIFGPLIEAHGEGGQIVSTASVFGLIAGGSPQYDVSKYGVVALSEGLRKALAPRRIGVSVLCPGVVRTQIVNSSRNVPRRFAGKIGSLPPTEGPVADAIKAFQHRTNNGIDPLYVGELVREAIENDWPYIFTDTEHEAMIDRRFAAIKQGFDRIRGRTPRR